MLFSYEGHGDGASRLTHIANLLSGYTYINLESIRKSSSASPPL